MDASKYPLIAKEMEDRFFKTSANKEQYMALYNLKVGEIQQFIEKKLEASKHSGNIPAARTVPSSPSLSKPYHLNLFKAPSKLTKAIPLDAAIPLNQPKLEMLIKVVQSANERTRNAYLKEPIVSSLTNEQKEFFMSFLKGSDELIRRVESSSNPSALMQSEHAKRVLKGVQMIKEWVVAMQARSNSTNSPNDSARKDSDVESRLLEFMKLWGTMSKSNLEASGRGIKMILDYYGSKDGFISKRRSIHAENKKSSKISTSHVTAIEVSPTSPVSPMGLPDLSGIRPVATPRPSVTATGISFSTPRSNPMNEMPIPKPLSLANELQIIEEMNVFFYEAIPSDSSKWKMYVFKLKTNINWPELLVALRSDYESQRNAMDKLRLDYKIRKGRSDLSDSNVKLLQQLLSKRMVEAKPFLVDLMKVWLSILRDFYKD